MKGVVYYLVGRKHWPHFAVSLMTLREHYDGRVFVFCGDKESLDMAGEVADSVCDISRSHSGSRNQAYSMKPSVCQSAPYEETIFLDADTLIVGEIDNVFPRGLSSVVLTRFSDWVTTGRMMSGRLERWRDVDPVRVSVAVKYSYPAVNTGVVGFFRASRFLKEWRELTDRGNGRFIADEISAQLLVPDFRDELSMLSDAYNASPVHRKSALGQVKIWHGHGQKFLKKDAGWNIWRPHFERALSENFAGIRDWWRGCNKYLDARLS